MVIIGLLLIALICLVLGLILQSAVWLVASLIATGGAGYLLYRLRDVIAAPKNAQPALLPELPHDVAKAAVVPRAAPASPTPDEEPDEVADEVPASEAREVPASEAPPASEAGEVPASEAGEVPASEAGDDGTALFDDDVAQQAAGADDDVWVIDGRPRYHLGDCAIIKGQDAEPIPFEQATEDGFMPCSLCEPHAARTR